MAMRRFRQILRWTSTEREKVLAEAKAWQDEERAAARKRIIGVAAVLDRPLYAQPTPPPEPPLLTRGQAARSEQAMP